MSDAISKAIDALKQAEAHCRDQHLYLMGNMQHNAIRALEALQHSGEPVGEIRDYDLTGLTGNDADQYLKPCLYDGVCLPEGTKLYTTPQPVVDITPDEAWQIMELMEAAFEGEKLILLGRASEYDLYRKLKLLSAGKGGE